GETKLAPTPRDLPSSLAGKEWLSPTRVSTLDVDVKPGEVGHFLLPISVTAEGDMVQTFALVEDGVTWFADAPKGGGPADDFLAVHVLASKAHVGLDIPINLLPPDYVPGQPEGPTQGLCDCSAGPAPTSPAALWLSLGALLVTAGRRRQRLQKR
ncbi:MAG: MYXO-CTERM sorting domain-containing protein, partial [Minicystis sp.]